MECLCEQDKPYDLKVEGDDAADPIGCNQWISRIRTS
ncbi:hypothetical protein J2S17_003576 [Cytobacillus purgationiresistens]|uniref:Uncharacterized protein n=1 Tax=Cytobacillus purgationiresistens TaxID=863449 RepID=A0ABU0AKA1_9BACI|nr:hypothetical protein [Cytobacillus purgationiresistens]